MSAAAEGTPRAHRVGLPSLFALGVNGIVGVGIFFTPNTIGRLVPGPEGALTYLATALLLCPVALTASLLARQIPVDGGPYVWARAAFGREIGWLVGWVTAVSALVSTTAGFLGVALQLLESVGGVGRGGMVALSAGVLSAVALTGLRPSAWVWNLLVVTKLVPLLVLLWLWFFPILEAPGLRISLAQPEWGRALLVALFPLQGFEVVPVLAGSARPGRHTVLVATLGALGFAAFLYALIQLACASALPELARTDAPLAQAAKALGGSGFSRLVELGANVSALGIAFGMVVMTPRYLAAIGEHSHGLAFLTRLNRRGVPVFALLVTFAAIVVLATFQSLESLFVLSSSAVLVQYVASSAALVRLALRREHGLAPRSALPAVLALGAIALLSLAVAPGELVVLGGLVVLGVVVMLASGRRGR